MFQRWFLVVRSFSLKERVRLRVRSSVSKQRIEWPLRFGIRQLSVCFITTRCSFISHRKRDLSFVDCGQQLGIYLDLRSLIACYISILAQIILWRGETSGDETKFCNVDVWFPNEEQFIFTQRDLEMFVHNRRWFCVFVVFQNIT